MPCQYASEESPSTIWVEVRDTSGPTEALRSWAAPTRGLTGGWPGWCWVHSELETAQEAGHPSTVGGEDTQVKSFLGRSRVCWAMCLHLEHCPRAGQTVRVLCVPQQRQMGPGKHPILPSWVTGDISHIQGASKARLS